MDAEFGILFVDVWFVEWMGMDKFLQCSLISNV